MLPTAPENTYAMPFDNGSGLQVELGDMAADLKTFIALEDLSRHCLMCQIFVLRTQHGPGCLACAFCGKHFGAKTP